MSDSRVRAIVRAAQSGDVDAWGVIEQALARIAPELPSKVYLLGYTGPDSGTYSDFSYLLFKDREEAETEAREILREIWEEAVGALPRRFDNLTTKRLMTMYSDRGGFRMFILELDIE